MNWIKYILGKEPLLNKWMPYTKWHDKNWRNEGYEIIAMKYVGKDQYIKVGRSNKVDREIFQ